MAPLEQLAPAYHWYWYGEVPPDGTAVRVTATDCPASMAADGGEIVAVRTGLTVNGASGEAVDAEPAELSVTTAQ
jgi:hypothetical protein